MTNRSVVARVKERGQERSEYGYKKGNMRNPCGDGNGL